MFIEPLAAALHAFDDVDLTSKDRVLLLGDGKLGLLIGRALAARRDQLGQALAVGRWEDAAAAYAEVMGGQPERTYELGSSRSRIGMMLTNTTALEAVRLVAARRNSALKQHSPLTMQLEIEAFGQRV